MTRNLTNRRRNLIGVLTLATMASTWGAAVAVSSSAGGAPDGSTKNNHASVRMQENRSFDSYSARLHYQGHPASTIEPLGGNPNPLGGAPIHPFLKQTLCEVADLNHSWN